MANFITLLRFPLLFVYVALLYTNNAILQFWCVPFIVFIILMDMFDGLIARARGEVSLLGSVLDIATDRTFEIILWVVFAHLGLIPIVIPLIVITRGTTVDAVRAVGMKDGLAAFEQVRHPISRFLVSSRFMRDSYGIAKGFAFAFLTLNLGLRTSGSDWESTVHFAALILSWLSITFTIARGLPVLIEGYRFLKNPSSTEAIRE
ncbi:MAG: CDP-alcohol phosphatidyltransferase family protein [Anaerolineales bacterium]|nr:CDP-alcohol phosphatidyltransferase family protein [Chloroflexota bacterium]MBL6979795.1 CDP-alcohol phosphatidyltransferase family protein [Anaerolineales bacterium]